MNFCTACGRGRRGLERYCTACGAPFPEPLTGEAPLAPRPAALSPARRPEGDPADATAGLSAARVTSTASGQRLTAPREPRRHSLVIAVVSVIILAGGGAGAAVLLRHQGSQPASYSSGSSAAPRVSVTRPGSPSASASSGPSASASASTAAGAGASASAGPEQTQLQLMAVAAQIQQSVPARSAVLTATQDVSACTMTPGKGIAMMNHAVSVRQAIIARLGTLPVSAVPGGQRLLADLGRLLRLSVRADQDFIGWMQDMRNSGSCPVSLAADASYQAAVQVSGQASTAKKRFLGLWNPLASQFGQPTFTASQI